MTEANQVGRIKGRFIPWYFSKFEKLIQLEFPNNIVYQGFMWTMAMGMIWIPIWFLFSEEKIVAKESEDLAANGLGNQQNPPLPAILTQVQESLKKADWAKIGKIAISVVGLLIVGFLAMISTILSGRMPCRYCGGDMDKPRRVCSRCGRSR